MALSSFSATWRLDVIRSLLGKQDEDATLTDLANINFSQGDILYHNGSDLVALSPGTSGNFLQTQGAGANPQWAEGASGDVSGPASATDGNVALFDGTTGKLIKDGGTLASIATSGSAADLTTGTLPDARISDTLTADKAYRRGNILGTVSQSGGTPTGELIEYGSNANGEYVRWADGTQESWNFAAATGSTDNAIGNVFQTNNASMTFAAAFSATPSVLIVSQTFSSRWPGCAVSVTTTGCNGRVFGPSSSALSIDFGYYAIGRWF